MRYSLTLDKVVFSLGAVCAASAFGAIESNVTVGAGSEWTDNVYYTDRGRRHDVRTELSVALDIASVNETNDYGMDYSITHENYMRDSFDNQNYMDGEGYFNAHLLPRRLYWNNQLASSVTLRDSISPNDPDNRDQRHYASTELEYVLISQARNSVDVSGQVSATRFRENSDNNNDRYIATLAWDHTLTELTDVGLTCSGESVDFNAEGADYETVQCYLSMTRTLRSGLVRAEVGDRTINPDRGDTLSGLYYSINFDWQDGPHSYTFHSFRDLTDTSVGLSNSDFEGGGTNPIDVNTDVLALTIRKRSEFQYSYSVTSRSSASAIIYRDSDDLYDSNLDTDREGIDLSYSHGMANNVSLQLSYDFIRTEYAQATPVETVDYTRFYTVELNKDFSQNFRGWWDVRAEIRDSDGSVQDYEVYSTAVNIAYTF